MYEYLIIFQLSADVCARGALAMGNAQAAVGGAMRTNYDKIAKAQLVGPYPSTETIAGSSLWASSPCRPRGAEVGLTVLPR